MENFSRKLTLFSGNLTLFSGNLTLFSGKLTLFSGKLFPSWVSSYLEIRTCKS